MFIAELIISGVTYDILKSIISKMWNKLKARIKSNKDNDLTNIFTKEDSLHEFYTYIMEFHEKRMCITEKQEKYIKEEIIADYCGEQSSIIYSKHKRLASVKELIIIQNEGWEKADKLVRRKGD